MQTELSSQPTKAQALDKIRYWKKEHGALILAHFYEEGDIQDIADHVGDSLQLAQFGQKSSEQVILLAGVVFMGESVKILSPHKTVLVPDLNAGCSLVHHSPFDSYLAWRKQHPNAICVSYINSSASVKAISDVICTSSNAERVLAAIPKDRPILFGPDRNLGKFLATKTGREMILWPGACEVHVLFSARKIFELKSKNPGAVVLAHPECDESVLNEADVVGSTSLLLKEVQVNKANEFIVATEPGIFHQMQRVRPDAKILLAPMEGSCACDHCPYMKMNTLKKIGDALEKLSPAILVDAETAKKAQISLQRMMDISEGKSVTWPAGFLA